ncbi:MAG: hypothetical protein HY866_12615 [Chloroflexi bacterium]|nr:hypothetical protein [Chloroflexota bacterium]
MVRKAFGLRGSNRMVGGAFDHHSIDLIIRDTCPVNSTAGRRNPRCQPTLT